MAGRKKTKHRKLEGWITENLDESLKLYMQENYLKSRTEVLNTALGRFLESRGYLKKDPDAPDGYRVTTPEQEAKRIGFHSKRTNNPATTSTSFMSAIELLPPNEAPSV